MTEKIFVVAGNFDQFKSFRQKLCLKMKEEMIPHRVQDIVYVGDPSVFRGFRNPWGYRTGNWQQRKDLDDIVCQVMICGGQFSQDFIECDL